MHLTVIELVIIAFSLFHLLFVLVLAVSSAEKVYIFGFENGNWVQRAELPQHDFSVTGLDWGPKTNRLVSSSHDKNSFVWSCEKNGTYKPELVLLRSQYGLSCVKWSPLGLF
jgi:actin related protein 2/3 complex subunit 1A/1B